MFSERLKKLDELPAKAWFGVAAILVFVCQLVAMALVVDGQVQRAQARHAHRAVQQDAAADCLATQYGAGLSRCLQQTRYVGDTPAPAGVQSPPVLQAQARHSPMPSVEASAAVERFMPTSFATR